MYLRPRGAWDVLIFLAPRPFYPKKHNWIPQTLPWRERCHSILGWINPPIFYGLSPIHMYWTASKGTGSLTIIWSLVYLRRYERPKIFWFYKHSCFSIYRIVASTSLCLFEAHAVFFRLSLMLIYCDLLSKSLFLNYKYLLILATLQYLKKVYSGPGKFGKRIKRSFLINVE